MSNKDTLKYNSDNNRSILDTLEVTSEIFKSRSHESLYRSAIRKSLNNEKVKILFDVSGYKPYWKPFHCNEVKFQQGKELKGSLCRKRWCSHCNRIRTAELIKGYQEPLQQLSTQDKLYMVTLTAPTVKGRQLKSEIGKRYKIFTKVKDRLRKEGLKLNGIRKLEVTYNEEKDWFHPHFHFLIQGKKEAYRLRKEWLIEYPTARIVGNHVTEIGTTAKDLMEIFKYATKDIVKDETTALATHVIFQALIGRRSFQTFGVIRKVKPPKKSKIESVEHDWLESKYDIWYFNEDEKDYDNVYGEMLIGTSYIEHQIKEKTRRTHEK